ncbi:GntR family transcriptional regulator [Cobetia amphilecti]|uniref:GntR family transcriptional regulator n=1 Tax=Cobetia amphilecti TaxID=1055104 RepID=UPI00254A3A56|nr:GntR family transcriptional regulator [Cobetia amphilecti]
MPAAKSKGASSRTLALKACHCMQQLALAQEEHLPESRLSDMLKVSRTPIRSALMLLSEEGVLERRPNRGFFLKDTAALQRFIAEHEAEEYREALPELSFTLALDYLKGDLGPELQETEVARVYSVTRSHAQQVLQAMEAEGWIAPRLGHGWEFNTTLTSPHSYDQCYRYRALIEPAALLEPTFRAESSELTRLISDQQDLLDGKSPQHAGSMFTSGTDLHESLVGFAHNPFLLDGLQKANRLRRLIEYTLSPVRDTSRRECHEHLQLLEMVAAGEQALAAEFMALHLQRAREEKVELVQNMLQKRFQR